VPRLTTEQVLALAPDPASAKAGTGLAAARKWSGLGRDADTRMVWGLCQGSGAKPYQTQVDLGEPAFRCTCPSRKFPCKHSLGLLLLLAGDEKLFKAGELPEWVAEWVASRAVRAERRSVRQERETEDKPIDAEARARRVANRADKITAGLEELDLWLCDLVRGGIAGMESRPSTFFDTMASRLIDAQAPGAARLVRDLAFIPTTGGGWHARAVAQLGRLHLLTAAWPRIETLTPEMQADVRAHLGWALTESELAGHPAVDDEWIVIGQLIDENERLRVRRTWVHGVATNRIALLLHFAPGAAPFSELLPPLGGSLRAELVFFPGSVAQRAAIRSRGEGEAASGPRPRPQGERSFSKAVGAFADALARDPWIERVPLLLEAVVPEQTSRGGWQLRDEAGAVLAIVPRFRGWTLLAVSGARPVWLSAEWTGEHLLPLAVAAGDTLHSLTAA